MEETQGQKRPADENAAVEEENKDRIHSRELRDKYANWAFLYLVCHSLFVVIVLLMSASRSRFDLRDGVLEVLSGSMAVVAVGLVYAVLASFGKDKEPPAAAGSAEGRTRRQSGKISGRRYVLQHPNDWSEEQQRELDAMPPQAKDIIDYLKERAVERKSHVWQESELKQEMIEAESEDRLITKQDPWRIFRYYRRDLIQHGFIRMEEKES